MRISKKKEGILYQLTFRDINFNLGVKMKNLNIGGLKISLPIIQGGMGVGISLSGLASAVANEGGVGVISPAGI